MNADQIAEHVTNNVSDFLDGHLIIGFVAGSNTPIISSNVPDAKTALAIQALLVNIISDGLPINADAEDND